MRLREFNELQAKRAIALADALDDYNNVTKQYQAECAADADRPAGTERDLAALEQLYYKRQNAAYSLQARIQDCAGLQFTIGLDRA